MILVFEFFTDFGAFKNQSYSGTFCFLIFRSWTLINKEGLQICILLIFHEEYVPFECFSYFLACRETQSDTRGVDGCGGLQFSEHLEYLFPVFYSNANACILYNNL